MRGRSLVASVTLLSFTTLIVWPRGACAQTGAQPAAAPAAPPPPPPPPANDDATMAQAKQHFETGRNAYNAGDYVDRDPRVQGGRGAAAVADPRLQHRPRQREAGQAPRGGEVLQALPRGAAERVEQGRGRAARSRRSRPRSRPSRRRRRAQPGGTAPPPAAAQVEQPGDMPPADPNADRRAAGAAGLRSVRVDGTAGAQPMARKPPKKKSYWWIGLIIGGARHADRSSSWSSRSCTRTPRPPRRRRRSITR